MVTVVPFVLTVDSVGHGVLCDGSAAGVRVTMSFTDAVLDGQGETVTVVLASLLQVVESALARIVFRPIAGQNMGNVYLRSKCRGGKGSDDCDGNRELHCGLVVGRSDCSADTGK